MSRKLLMNKIKTGADEIEPYKSGLVGWLDVRNQSGNTWRARIGNNASLREFVGNEGFRNNRLITNGRTNAKVVWNVSNVRSIIICMQSCDFHLEYVKYFLDLRPSVEKYVLTNGSGVINNDSIVPLKFTTNGVRLREAYIGQSIPRDAKMIYVDLGLIASQDITLLNRFVDAEGIAGTFTGVLAYNKVLSDEEVLSNFKYAGSLLQI